MRALVTGGGGFVGQRVVQLLRAQGAGVRVLSRRRHAELDALGAESTLGDVRDKGAVTTAMSGVDIVFHLAAKVGMWGRREEFTSVNVEGTRTVLQAALRAGVPRFVYTSTPSVVGYAADVENGGPELPYARAHESVYAESKAEAERLVLGMNGGAIATVALRPHLVIGPGDAVMLPRLVDRAKRGLLRVIGDGRNRVDLTSAENAAWAHIDAASALGETGAPCAGRAYFISNGEPVVLWDWVNALLLELGIPPVRKHISLGVGRAVGSVSEAIWKGLRLRDDPPMTRFLASVFARSHWYDIGPAARDLRYVPRVSLEETRRRIVDSLR